MKAYVYGPNGPAITEVEKPVAKGTLVLVWSAPAASTAPIWA